MEPLTIVFLVLCILLAGVVVWLIVSKLGNMTSGKKDALFERGIAVIRQIREAYDNDGRFDTGELRDIAVSLIDLVAFIGGTSESAVKIRTGTEELLSGSTAE